LKRLDCLRYSINLVAKTIVFNRCNVVFCMLMVNKIEISDGGCSLEIFVLCSPCICYFVNCNLEISPSIGAYSWSDLSK
jgi:hypothetical protein